MPDTLGSRETLHNGDQSHMGPTNLNSSHRQLPEPVTEVAPVPVVSCHWHWQWAMIPARVVCGPGVHLVTVRVLLLHSPGLRYFKFSGLTACPSLPVSL